MEDETITLQGTNEAQAEVKKGWMDDLITEIALVVERYINTRVDEVIEEKTKELEEERDELKERIDELEGTLHENERLVSKAIDCIESAESYAADARSILEDIDFNY